MQAEDDFWGEYWESGALTSMADGFESNYQGDLRAGWEGFFASFGQGSRVLDIGTGNGAIATIAAEVSRRDDLALDVHGADRADIDPARTVKSNPDLISGIAFHPRASSEDLPFDDESVDGISAQFAFEYADHEAAMSETRRILRPGGRARFVMHDHDSEVLRRGREQLRQIGLIESLAFYDVVESLLPHISALAGGDAASEDSEACRNKVNDVGAAIGDEARESFSPESLQFAMGFASRSLELVATDGLPAALELIARGRTELAGARLRYSDLIRAAGPAGQGLKLADLARSLGFADVELAEVRHAGGFLIGQRLTLRKPG